MRKKKPKKELPRLIKVSNIECLNGNRIIIGQLRRETESEPILWEYTVLSPEGKTLYSAQFTDKYQAFNEAVSKATKHE